MAKLRKPRKKEQVSFRLTGEQKESLERLAGRQQKDVSEFLRDLVLREIGQNKAA